MSHFEWSRNYLRFELRLVFSPIFYQNFSLFLLIPVVASFFLQLLKEQLDLLPLSSFLLLLRQLVVTIEY